MATITCPKCGNPDAETSRKYCHKCGGRLADNRPAAAITNAATSSPNRTFAPPAARAATVKQTKYMSSLTFFFILVAFSIGGAIVAELLSESFPQLPSVPLAARVVAGPLVVAGVLQIMGYKIGKPKATDR